MSFASMIAKALRETGKNIDDIRGIDPKTKKPVTEAKRRGRKQTEAAVKGTATNRSTMRKSAGVGAAAGSGTTLAATSKKEEAPKRERKAVSVRSDKKKDPYAGGVDALTTAALAKLNKADDKKETKKAAPKTKTSAKKDMSFGEAFKAARKAGKKEFTWRGNKYHTQTKDEQMSMEKFSKGGYKKAKRKMAGGGMVNGKKPRTGSMDYRKGGLFR